MKVFAPGKLVLTGAYAVLEGAPAIAIAVSRGAWADTSRLASVPTPEVAAAFDENPPAVDASAMFEGDRKLGLGASSAILVASLGARAAAAGGDLASASVRESIFASARAAHAQAQRGGSGVDVATSVYGGAIRYQLDAERSRVQSVSLPESVRVSAFVCPISASTPILRAAVARLAEASPTIYRTRMDDLHAIAIDAAEAVAEARGSTFVGAIRRAARSLARLGHATSAAIVPVGFEELEARAEGENAAFCVSGAGGGDVAVFVGPNEPSPQFVAGASALGLCRLDLSLDPEGVRVAPEHHT